MTARVALVRPLARLRNGEFQEPLGIECIAGQLKKEGIDHQIFDAMLDWRQKRNTLAAIRAYRPTLVGFSLMSEDETPDALRMMSRLDDGNTRFCAGGLLVTTATKLCEALFPKHVTLLRGEGEKTLTALALHTAQERVITESSPQTPDQWPVPSRPMLNQYLTLGCVINLRTSRGCSGHCTFCATPTMPAPFGARAERSLERIAAEMAELSSIAQAGGYAPAFNFVDDDFGSVERMEALCELLRQRNGKTAFALEVRGETLIGCKKDTAERLARGGLCRIFTGLENLDAPVLRRWGKPMDPQALLLALDTIQACGIRTHAGYILWHRDMRLQDVPAQMDTLHRHGLFSPKAALSQLIVFPGSRLFDSSQAAAYPQPLPPLCEMAHQRVKETVGPMMDMWEALALKLPPAVCKAYLSGDNAAVQAIEQEMERINDAAYKAMMNCF